MPITQHFAYWDEYFGEMLSDNDERFPSKIFGFENISQDKEYRWTFQDSGAVYGYVTCGGAILNGRWELETGEYFCLANGGTIELDHEQDTRVMAVQRLGWLGLNMVGGPIENRGRLKYIDTCSDTLLISPPKWGDPCFNHLHFPEGIDQTAHTHPSTRAGMVARGLGSCITPDGEYDLMAGRLFYIPTDGMHRFCTLRGESMDVIPYHPDSDFGPQDEEHPMVNRTWVEGEKIDNTQGRHAQAETMETELTD